MSRRLPISSQHPAYGGRIPFVGAIHAKTRTLPLLPIGLLVWGAMLIIIYSLQGSGTSNTDGEVDRKLENGTSCTLEVIKALPILNKVYGDSMNKVLHVGPDTCSVVPEFLKEEDTEAWGVEPYDLVDASANCKKLVRKGIVRIANIKFPLPYKEKSFSLVLVSDALDYLSPRYLNTTIPELARVAVDGVVIFTGLPDQHRTKVAEKSRFGRPAKLRSRSWWISFFIQSRLEDNESATKKFEQASEQSYKPACQVFHLKS